MQSAQPGMVIIGAGVAGFLTANRMAAKLMERGNFNPITLIGSEPYIPYDRTALSKDFLMGGIDAGRLNLQPPNWYVTANVILQLGEAVTAIDRNAHVLTLARGKKIEYSGLVLATGAKAKPLFPALPSPLPAKSERRRIVTLENLDDALYLREYLQVGIRLVIIGGGFIGLELASIAARMGCLVTIVEARNHALAGVIMPEITERLIEIHRLRSVEFFTQDYCISVNERPDLIEVNLARHGTLIADLVVVGIGIAPQIELAAACGLEAHPDYGIQVNEQGQTSDPRIFAVGRCSYIAAPLSAGEDGAGDTNPQPQIIARPRHVGAIQDQIDRLIAHVFQESPPPPNLPLITSEQYGIELSILGNVFANEPVLWRGHPLREPSLAFLTDQGRVIGAVGFNAGQDIQYVSSLIKSKKPIAAASLVDLRIKLSDLARKAAK
ncbi:MAG: FAD-dependent oxidoreductase [Candidatus Symbiobacter sp.]|nr:FAD-dependent oxidoreductase [Candidatus Symbiobacter sp.]